MKTVDKRIEFYKYQTANGMIHDEYEESYPTWGTSEQNEFDYHARSKRLYLKTWRSSSESVETSYLGKVVKAWSKRVFICDMDKDQSPYKDEDYKEISL